MMATLENLVLKDIWLKLFSLAMAMLIWVLVHISQAPLTARPLGLAPVSSLTLTNLPVMIMSSAEDVRSFRVKPKEVDVTVQGAKNVLDALNRKEVHVLVDLTGVLAANALRAHIEVSTPAGVSYVRVYPEEVQVIFPPRN